VPSSDPLTIVAGSLGGVAGFVDGVGPAARFSSPFDTKLNGDASALFITDIGNRALRRMDTATYAVTTVRTWAAGLYPARLAVHPISNNVYVSVLNWPGNSTEVWKISPAGASTLIGTIAGGWGVAEVTPDETTLIGSWQDTAMASSFVNNKRNMNIATGVFTVFAGESAFASKYGAPGSLLGLDSHSWLIRDYIPPSASGCYVIDNAAPNAAPVLLSPYDLPPTWFEPVWLGAARKGPTTMAGTRGQVDPFGGFLWAIREIEYNPVTHVPLAPVMFAGKMPYSVFYMGGLAYANDAYFVASGVALTGGNFGVGPPNPAFTGDPSFGHAIWSAGAVIPPPVPVVSPSVASCSFGRSTGYSAAMFSRASGALICAFNERFDGNWTRKLDKTSTVDLTVTDSCCSCVPVPWAHEIALYRAGQREPVWQGPVDSVTDTGREIRVTGLDKSGYWYKRATSADLSHAGAPVDAAVLFSELVAQAELGSPSGLAFVPSGPTGVQVTRVLPTNQKIGPALDDLANGAIDWTVVGLRAYAGGVTISAGGALVLTTADDWTEQERPEIITDGTSQVTRVILHGQGAITAIYPPGPAVPDPIFGIVEEEISRPQIASQSEADAYARSYYDRHQGPQVHISTARAALSKRFPYEMADLIPGRLFNVLVNTACADRLLTLRLSALIAEIVAGHEAAVRIDLQPVGKEKP